MASPPKDVPGLVSWGKLDVDLLASRFKKKLDMFVYRYRDPSRGSSGWSDGSVVSVHTNCMPFVSKHVSLVCSVGSK